MQLSQAPSSQSRSGEQPRPPRRVLIIINPHSRRGGDADLQQVVDALKEGGLEVVEEKPDNAKESLRLVGHYRDQVDLIVVGGGDGTVNAMVAALKDHHLPLAILPLGTANDLARSLALSDDLSEAARLVLNNAQRKIDLGRVNGRYFVNAVNIGLGTEITHQLTEETKKTWGTLSYLKAVWEALSRKHTFRAIITVDGRTYHQRSIHMTIGNGRYYGGGNIVDEHAEIDSGLLHLYSIKPQSLWRLVFLAPLLRLGKHALAKRTFSISGRRIEIRTSKPMEVHADGEAVSRTPALIEILPKALTVYAPPKDPVGKSQERSPS